MAPVIVHEKVPLREGSQHRQSSGPSDSLAGSELLAGCPCRNRLLSKNITLLQARSTPRPLTGFSLSQASFIWNGLPGPQENTLSGACACQLRPAALAQLHGESAVGTVAPERLSDLWPTGFPLGFCTAVDFMASLMGSLGAFHEVGS